MERINLIYFHRKGSYLRLLMLIFAGMLLCCARVSAQEITFTNRDEIITYLTEQKPDILEFTCGEDLYDDLSQNNFENLQRLLVKAGVSLQSVQISYRNTEPRLIRVTAMQYTNIPWSECGSIEEAEAAIRNFKQDPNGFILLCTPQLFARLTKDNALSYYMAQNGISGCRDFITPGIIRISDITFFDKPYAFVQDYAQFSAAVSNWAKQGISDFYVVFERDLFNRIMDDTTENRIMTGSSMLLSYYANIYIQSCTFHYTSAEYTDLPREICRTIEDVPNVFRRMGASGISDFELIFPYRDVFDALYEDNFKMLHELEADAGLSSAQIAYSYLSHDSITYHDAVITPDAVRLTTLSDVISYTEKLVDAGEKDIHLFCTPEVYEALLGSLSDYTGTQESMNRIYDLIAHAGISAYDLTISQAAHCINIHINHLMSGKAIVLADKNGGSRDLTAREQETYAAAVKIAEAATASDPLTTAKNIHDWLCGNTVYTVDETTDEDDNAIGAILNGYANCDGYTDAFYLIGSLAGLNIRYQHGDSENKSIYQILDGSTHIWNLLEIDGSWHMTDVTWDDDENGWSYIWFNVGNDYAKKMHTWNEDMTVSLAETTQRAFLADGEFYLHSGDELRTAVDLAKQRGLSCFHFIFETPDAARLMEEAKTLVSQKISGTVLRYSWNEKMSLLSFYDINW